MWFAQHCKGDLRQHINNNQSTQSKNLGRIKGLSQKRITKIKASQRWCVHARARIGLDSYKRNHRVNLVVCQGNNGM